MQDATPVNNLDTQMESGNARPLSFADAMDEAQEAMCAAAKLEAEPLRTDAKRARIRSLLADAANLIEYAEGLI